MSHISDLRSQVQQLVREELFDSAEALAGVLIACCRDAPQQAAEAAELFGDIAYGKQEYKRALVCVCVHVYVCVCLFLLLW